MPNKTREYLGDGVYGEVENGHIKLTVDYGMGPVQVNAIYLEDQVLASLLRFIKKHTTTTKNGS